MINELIFYSFAIYGLSWIITKSSLFEFLRNFVKEKELTFISKFLNCIVCVSVWIAIGFTFFGYYNYPYLLAASYAAGFTWIMASLIDDAS